MNCYNCKGFALKPVRLDHGLPARQCSKCTGTHIDLLTYRHWREENTDLITKDADVQISGTEDNNKALICQCCSKLMLKYKISSEYDNYIDLCSTCDDVWLDRGEWNLLKHLHLEGKLTEITTTPWQRNMRHEAAETALDERYIQLLGNEEYNKLKEITDWLSSNKYRRQILRYLHIKIDN